MSAVLLDDLFEEPSDVGGLPDPLIHYDFKEGSGDNFTDQSGNGHHAHSDNPVTEWRTGYNGSGSALFGKAISDAVVNHGIGTGDFTVIMILLIPGLSSNSPLWANGSYAPVFYAKTSSQISLYHGSHHYFSDPVPPIDTHLQMTYRRIAGVGYYNYNGVDDSTTVLHTNNIANAVLAMNSNGSSLNNTQEVSDFKLFTEALTEQQISDHWTNF